MFMADIREEGECKRSLVEELDALSRIRPLTQLEALRLDRALRRSAEPKGQKPWTKGDLGRLKRYLTRGKKPAQIAILMSRTERAIWRKMYLEKLTVASTCPAHIPTPSRLRVIVQSRSSQ